MAPLKDTFGEEWVEMEEDEEDNCIQGKIKERVCKSENEMDMEAGEHKPPQKVGGREGRVDMEKEHKNTPALDGRLETREVFRKEEAFKEDHMKREWNHYINGKKERNNSREEMGPCTKTAILGRVNGEKNGVSMIKRVMSEACFMKGQVMVSKGMEAVSRKREGRNGILDEDNFHKDGHYGEGTRSREQAHGVINAVFHKDLNNGEARMTEEMEGIGKTEKITKPHAIEQVYMDLNKLQPITMHTKTCDEVPEMIQTTPEAVGSRAKPPEVVDLHEAAIKDLQEDAHMQIKTTEPAHTQPMVASHTKLSREGATISVHSNASPVATRRPRVKPLEVILMAKEMEQKQEELEAKQPQLEVKEVKCECCKLSEECSFGYIEHVKGCFSGHWVCGLCAEAVQEERHRLGKGIPMEVAVRAHMNLCRQFSSKKANNEPPSSPGVAHAVCHLLSRHLSDPTSPHHKASPRPELSRTSSCLPSFSHGASSSTK